MKQQRHGIQRMIKALASEVIKQHLCFRVIAWAQAGVLSPVESCTIASLYLCRQQDVHLHLWHLAMEAPRQKRCPQ